MKAATVKQIKDELENCSAEELLKYCLRLSKFKKENKELLTYLLFEASNESLFVREVKEEISAQFVEINRDSYYYIKKSVRKILRNCKKHIRYSDVKETEVEIMIHFCSQMSIMEPSYKKNIALINLLERQMVSLKKSISALHADLQFDYQRELEEILEE